MSLIESTRSSANGVSAHRLPGTVLTHGSLNAKSVTATLWRVSARDDRVLGHVRLVDSKHGERFAATLILPGGIRTLFLGEFWSLSDALDCFL